MDQISQLAKFLLPEEKAFLAKQVFFKEESSPEKIPPSLNANRQPRNRAIGSNPYKVELLKNDVYISDDYKMIGQDVETIMGAGVIKFCCEFIATENFCLKAVDILCHANNNPDLKRNSKKAR